MLPATGVGSSNDSSCRAGQNRRGSQSGRGIHGARARRDVRYPRWKNSADNHSIISQPKAVKNRREFFGQHLPPFLAGYSLASYGLVDEKMSPDAIASYPAAPPTSAIVYDRQGRQEKPETALTYRRSGPRELLA